MAEFLGTPKVQYFDTTTGQPLVGGKLYTYEPGPGSTTPKATYSTIADAAASTNPNTNPVILDARGEANVVLSGSTKFVLNRSDDTNIWTVDAVGSTGNSIFDPNGNEIVIYNYVAAAVNEVTISNAATTDSPSILATGGDTNINFIVNPKGTGGIDIGTKVIDTNENEILTLTATASAVNYLDIANSITATNVIITSKGDDADVGLTITPKGAGKIKLGLLNLPPADGTIGQFVKTDGAGQLGFLGGIAVQADQETGTSIVLFVTPGTQHYHQSSSKGWAKFGVVGNILASYNVTSVTDASTGIAIVNWTNNFSSVNYVVDVNVSDTLNDSVVTCTTQSAGAITVQKVLIGGSFKDPTVGWNVCAFGDL